MKSYARTVRDADIAPQLSGGPIPIRRPLESITTATQRINSAIVGVQCFLDRFNGGPQESDIRADGSAPPPPQHYAGELERLMSAIERLELRISALDEIG